MTSTRSLPTSLCLLALALAPAVAAQSWPSFRGPHATGVADGQDLPASWNVESGENVLWRAELPGLAHS
ncbi:MAG TPA: serine/threonine protein kinase, partial [Planctomycetota bacterium]|nr:serine/threonine protein kinase [Planctomycetota bacterium]